MLTAEISVQAADGSRERFPLLKERITIGRSRESDIFLPDQWLSRQHAEIRQKPDGFYVNDLGSKNGTLLNGGRLTEEQRLRAGDIITLGEHILTFSLGGEPGDEETEADSDPIGTRSAPLRRGGRIRPPATGTRWRFGTAAGSPRRQAGRDSRP